MSEGKPAKRVVRVVREALSEEQSRKRHMEPGWYEWVLREFLRYMYAVGLLALLTMGPLQMAASWLPYESVPLVDPVVVGFVVWGPRRRGRRDGETEDVEEQPAESGRDGSD